MYKFLVVIHLFFLCSLINVLNGQCITGQCIDGKGSYIYKNGSKYSGNFANSLPHGWGVMTQKNGVKYEGEFNSGQKHGKGKIVFASGEIYEGDFKYDIIEGYGKMNYKKGDVYTGNWAVGKPAGEGKYIFFDGDVYEGDFIDGMFSGYGKFTAKNGTYYEGEWLRNMKHGRGKMYSNGQLKEVYYENNKPMDTKEILPKPDLKDCLEVYCHNEKGKYRYKDGSVYVGDFVNNIGEGNGECTYANGDKYMGGWKNHAPHGKGFMTFASGKVLYADWINGQPNKIIRNEVAKANVVVRKENPPKSTTIKPSSSIPNAKSNIETPETLSKMQPKIYAVIVGVASYLHMPSLKYTDDDAYQLYAFLKSPEGGALKDDQIRVLIDDAATSTTIMQELKSMIKQPKENDVLMIYLAGHGLEGSFLPSDYDGYNFQLPYNDIIELIGQSKAKHKVLITDACHSGSMLATARSPWTVALDNFYSAYDIAKGGTAILTSSKRDETSLEYSGFRQGVFTHFLIKGLKGAADTNGDKLINMEELSNFVSQEVKQYTQNAQNPKVSGDFDPKMPIGWVR